MTTVGELIEALERLGEPHQAHAVVLVVEGDDGSQMSCSGDISVDLAEAAKGEVMLVGEED